MSRYDLITSPARELPKLCRHLDITYSPSMHSDYQSAPSNRNLILDKHRSTIHRKIEQGLDAGNSGKFATEMSPLSRLAFELVAAPYLERYGYVVEYPVTLSFWLAPLRNCLFLAARVFNNLRYHHERFVLVGWLLSLASDASTGDVGISRQPASIR